MSETSDIDILITELHDKLTLVHHDAAVIPKSDLINLFLEVVSLIKVDYATYRKYIPKVLGLLEKNKTSSIVVLVDSFFVLFNLLTEKRDLIEVDDSALKEKYEDEVIDKFYSTLEKSLTYGIQIRISDFDLDKSDLTNGDKRQFISILVDAIQDSAKTLSWDYDRANNVFLQLAAARNLLNDQNDHDSFYILSAMMLDRFSTSEFHQQSRDVAEELIICSYIDSRPHLGYFNSFRCYSNNSSAIPALLYACLSMSCALESGTQISSKYVKEIIWQGIKYFRNISLHPWVKAIYESIPNHISFDPYEKRSIAHSYFTSLLFSNDKNVPSLILDFLNEHREEIYQTGIHDALPWLITLYNVRRIYADADFSSTGLGYYLSTFEMIVPPDKVANQKAIIEGDLSKLKPLLRESLIKLNETRNPSDIVNDNNNAIKMASRLVDQAIASKDHEALLLAMMVKSDFSFIFTEKERQEIAPLNVPETSLESFEKIYGSKKTILQNLSTKSQIDFLWLITTEGRCYHFSYVGEDFEYASINSWGLREFKALINSGFFSQFAFDDTMKSKNEVRSVFPEEHIDQSNKYKANFEFFRLDINQSTSPLLVVMDMDLAGFPHNLLLSREGDIIHSMRPLANILSTEWYVKYSNQVQIDKAFPKSVWIPTEGGDFTLNQLFGKLEDSLVENKFTILQSLDPKNPINTDLNIICAHGSNDIALKQVVFPDDTPRLNLDRYLSSGKVLIFFVCHSGSISSTPFENSISSIVKKYIAKGYSSVIAPFWALHINIPPIWLPVFLKSIEDGKSIIEAVHDANLAVKEVYPTLAAWCCLHLYGDPHITLSK
ncbi:hypothetical protein AAOE16_15645 [Ekhidna sp. MALMAid0563]|uniref:hypothetical protein n=1 Tax=Ekhidna sp. MALMAid0563 TaxID=3143937 RepID=UPI0032DEC792